METFGLAAEPLASQDPSQDKRKESRQVNSPCFYNKSLNSRTSINSQSSRNQANDSTLKNCDVPVPVNSLQIYTAKQIKTSRRMPNGLRTLPRVNKEIAFMSQETLRLSTLSQLPVSAPPQQCCNQECACLELCCQDDSSQGLVRG